MRNLLRLIVTYNFFLLFVVFEIIAVSITIKNSNVKLNVFLSSANSVTAFFNKKSNNVQQYFNLKKTNKTLILENQKLHNKISVFDKYIEKESIKVKDESFNYQVAEVVKNSVFNTYNFITINKGKKNGVKPDMAVVSPDGVVGITAVVGNNYSTVISVLNTKLEISSKLKKNDFFGSISWNAADYRYVYLTEIPDHVKVAKGDTVVTTGYSAIFPKNITVGYVQSVSKVSENNFFNIKVKLAQDFKSLRYVYIIENKGKTEKDSIENITEKLYGL